MMRGLSTLLGVIKIKFEHAAVSEIINSANQEGIILHEITLLDELTAEITLSHSHATSFKALVENRGGLVIEIKHTGLRRDILLLRKRAALVWGILIFLASAIFLPTRVLFVTVEGNSSVSAETIKSGAEECGVYFGALRREIKSEHIKNHLLSAVPQLQWAGINTYGCVAIISVRERSMSDTVKLEGTATGVVAKCDGIVKRITASSGNILCRVGESVKAGQLLVSGYTDCGISVKLSPAEAEIYAHTLRNISAVMPVSRIKRVSVDRENSKISLIIGKKLINFFKGSGISDVSCVKIYKKYYMTLPGGFVLPFGCLIETQAAYETKLGQIPDDRAADQISALSKSYLLETMVAGEILSSRVHTKNMPDFVRLTGQYNCDEMIGQTYNEEIIEGNE